MSGDKSLEALAVPDGIGDPPVVASGVDWEDMRIGGGGRGEQAVSE